MPKTSLLKLLKWAGEGNSRSNETSISQKFIGTGSDLDTLFENNTKTLPNI